MITEFSKVNGNIKLNTNNNVNNHNWLSFILPILGQVWSDEAFVFMHKHAGLKLGFGIQGTEIRPSVLVYSSDKNERVRIFMKVNGLVEEVFAEDGDIMFDDPHEAIQYVEHVEVLDAVAEIADVVLSALLDTVKEKNETTTTNDAAASAKAVVDDLIKKFGFNADAIYHRNDTHYVIHGGFTICIKLGNSFGVNEVYVGHLTDLPEGFMQALRTAENLVKIYNL